MVSFLMHTTALAVTIAGALCFYLSAPRQIWLKQHWPARPGRAGGAIGLYLGWVIWCGVMHPATAFFTSLTVVMLVLTALPFMAAVPVLLRKS